MSNSDENLLKSNNYSENSNELNINDSSDNISIESEAKLNNFEILSYESKDLNLNNDMHSNDFNSLESEINENSFSKEFNLNSLKNENIDNSKKENSEINNLNDELFEFDFSNIKNLKNSEESTEEDKYDDLILTMKVTIDKNNLNKVIIPENVSVDKLLKISRDNYLNEIDNLKKKEIDNLKKEIHEINSSKFESIFKNLMQSYNLDLDKKIDQIYLDDKISEKNISESKSSYDKLDSDPFLMDYQMINTKGNDSISNSLNDKNKLSLKKKSIVKSYEFKEYFDCIYIINLPNERNKINYLTNIFNKDRIKYKIIDGILAKSDTKYMKFYQRWMYQKNLDQKFMNKFIFDEKIYLKKNQDLVGLNNKSKCWTHWIREGRHSNRNLYDKTNILLDSQLGNLIAHMNVIRDALYENYSNILILEDDVFIHNDFNALHINLINKINNNYSLLFYGAIQKNWSDINLENNFYKANNTYGGFAYALKSNIFEVLLEKMNELVDPIDKLLLNLQYILKSCYVSYPNIFITDLENGKIHRKRDMEKYSKHFRWKLGNYMM